jgi:SAM-dependent methyltransferase
MNWRVKSLVQKLLGYVPAGETIHYLLQRRLGGLKDFGAEFESKVEDWTIMVGHLRSASRPIPGARLLEVGTGWYPTFPFACFLAGAKSVLTFDLNRHLKPALTRDCAHRLGERLDVIASACEVPLADVQQRHRQLCAALADRVDLGAATGGVVDYRAPADARNTGLGRGSIDCVFSNSVLEHVPADAIEGIFREAERVLAPAGIMFHSVNCGDHYAYVDRSISQLHYLRYSDDSWRLWQNAFLYQNRLRAHEFVDMSLRAGFTIDLNTAHPTEEGMRELEQIAVHPRFAHLSREQLCITTIDFISRKPGGGEVSA